MVDHNGTEIVLLSDIRSNPIPAGFVDVQGNQLAENPENVLPVFTGFDKDFFLEQDVPANDGMTFWERIMFNHYRQLTIVLPYPEEWVDQIVDDWRTMGNPGQPAIVKLIRDEGPSVYNLFPQDVRDQMRAVYARLREAFDSGRVIQGDEQFNVPLTVIPEGFSVRVVYPGIANFHP
jgi:hypothetical protein